MTAHYIRLFAGLLMIASVSTATTIYASASGDALNSCTLTFPCDVQTACALANAGDTLQLEAGTYNLEEPCEIQGQGVTVQGEGIVKVACTGTCFSFGSYPISLMDMELKVGNGSDTGAAAVSFPSSEHKEEEGEEATVISNLYVELLNASFVNAQFERYNMSGQGASFSFSDILLTGTAASEGVKGPIYLGTISPNWSVALRNITVDHFETAGSLLYVDYQADTLIMDSISVTHSTLCSVVVCGGGDATITDLTMSNVTLIADETDSLSEMFFLNSFFSVTIAGLTLDSVSGPLGVVYAAATDIDISDVSIINCSAPMESDSYAFYLSQGLEPEERTITITDMSFLSSSYGAVIYARGSGTLATDFSLSGFSFMDSTSTVRPVLATFELQLNMTDFVVSDSNLPWGLLELDSCGQTTVSNGSLTSCTGDYEVFVSSGMTNSSNDDVLLTYSNIYVTDVDGDNLFLISPSGADYNVAITGCSIYSSTLDNVILCIETGDSDTGFVSVSVSDTSCKLCGDDMTDAGFSTGDSCEIDSDDQSVCGDEYCDDTGLNGWAVFTVLALLSICVAVIVIAIVVAGLLFVKKQRQAIAYEEI